MIPRYLLERVERVVVLALPRPIFVGCISGPDSLGTAAPAFVRSVNGTRSWGVVEASRGRISQGAEPDGIFTVSRDHDPNLDVWPADLGPSP